MNSSDESKVWGRGVSVLGADAEDKPGNTARFGLQRAHRFRRVCGCILFNHTSSSSPSALPWDTLHVELFPRSRTRKTEAKTQP